MADFIKKYRIDFFYEKAPAFDSIWLADAGNPAVFPGTPVQAVVACRIDLEMGTHESLETVWKERAIGVGATSTEDVYNKAYGRQIALLRAVDGLSKDDRRFLLEHWFREHRAVKGAKAGDPTKFKRLVELVEWSEKAKAWMAEPLFYEGPKESAKSA